MFGERLRRALRGIDDHFDEPVDVAFGRRKAGRREAGIAEYRRVLAQHPDDALARVRLAVVLGHAGPTDEVMTLLAEALDLAPDLAEAYRERARLYIRAGRAGAALADLDRALYSGRQQPWDGSMLASALTRLPSTKTEKSAQTPLPDLYT